MSEQNLTGFRRQQVLRLLADYGPLSIRSLEAFSEPPIQRKRLNRALKRMLGAGLIRKRNDGVFRGAGVYYQLAKTKTGMRVVSEILSLPLEKLKQPWVRHLELLHSEKCAAWAEWFKQLAPDATVLREHHFRQDPLVTHVLSKGVNDFDLRPDVMLLLQRKSAPRKITIGIEIEKSQKADKRILARLRRYVDGTQLDGVIYICDHEDISDRIKLLYKSRVLKEALRIRHYGDHFFLFATGVAADRGTEPLMFNAAGAQISISKWIATLEGTDVDLRRDRAF